MQTDLLHSRRACFGAAGNLVGGFGGRKPSIFISALFLKHKGDAAFYTRGLHPSCSPTGFPARFAGGNGGSIFGTPLRPSPK